MVSFLFGKGVHVVDCCDVERYKRERSELLRKQIGVLEGVVVELLACWDRADECDDVLCCDDVGYARGLINEAIETIRLRL